MNLRKVFLWSAALCLVLLSFVFHIFFKAPKKEKESFFVVVPISKFTSSGVPCVQVSIENIDLHLEIDLGFTGYVSVNSRILPQLENKLFVKTQPVCGWKGDHYVENVYEIPQVKLNEITFNRILLNEESSSFLADSKILDIKGFESSQSDGRLGWKFFKKSNLFLDVKNKRVVFCDGIETLRDHGIALDDFVKAPVSLDRGIVEIEIFFQNEVKNCLLDTGFTWNILPNNSTDFITQEDRFLLTSSIKIGRRNFENIDFDYLPLNMPIKIESILGMNFFQLHQIFIDFNSKQIYCSL